MTRFFRALWALRVGPWITLASYPPPSLRLLGVWGATEQKVHLSPAPARKPLWRLVSSGKPRFCRTLSRNGSVR
ncbi:hypothetical protein CDL16_17745 [Pseudomonas aeruginosa]|nr:hypothetical protein CDL16_17745 [Pseudomonas aeruginosa]